MRIAFDAKRAFLNRTGLGQYSRTLIDSLYRYYPDNSYYLTTPNISDNLYEVPNDKNINTISPKGLFRYKPLNAVWRSWLVKKELTARDIDVFHGLSHEVPLGIKNTGIRTVVTMHDLIFERYPKQYKAADVAIYRKKFRYACESSDKIIAISHQTKADLVSYYGIAAEKIHVCYQSCSLSFQTMLTAEQHAEVRSKYNLPQEYVLYVGSIIERKNLLNICKALKRLGKKIDIPLVVVGTGKDYAQKVRRFINENDMARSVIFLSDKLDGNPDKKDYDLPGIYQLASLFIYPSVFEGFGIPVLEALYSKTPVITSNVSCLPEAGGDAAKYIDPTNIDEMAEAVYTVLNSEQLKHSMVQKGLDHAEKFSPKKTSSSVMDVYKSLL